ncbi:hypothetical protein BGY98DRAFT_920581 [Russula aff. rugulosa BPL654]|nr:hypothetical protein BGY98DRAFT_920581 [Russula aff. rugulosa BPL654]
MRVARRRCWPRQLSFTEYVSWHRICGQPSTDKWFTGFQLWRAPTLSISTPIIQKAVNITWFQNKNDIGIILHEHFNPIPFEVIALAVTVIECCIDEWSTGTCIESSWKEELYKTNYVSHLNSLRDLNTHGTHHEGKDLVWQIQRDLLSAAR